MRRGERTVNELADELGLTDNAVRLHLAGLERDGLVSQAGVRRGAGKPSFIYRLTPEGEALFPKGYATLLNETIGLLSDWDADGLEETLRAVGQRAASRIKADGDVRERVDQAVGVLGELGGLAEVVEDDEGILIQGYSCPLSSVVSEHPKACVIAEELLSGIVGVPVKECCDKNSAAPKCLFRIEVEP
jgi:predicted ArsR family transcriptional regulator